MSKKESTAWLELTIMSLIILIVAALFWSSLDLPESLREPLGSATIPQAVCLIVSFFCLILIGRSVKSIRDERALDAAATGNAESQEKSEPQIFRPRPDLAVKALLITIIYVALIQTYWIPSEILTPLFLAAIILLLNEFRRSAILPAVVIALVIGLGTNFLFTDFFYIDLP